MIFKKYILGVLRHAEFFVAVLHLFLLFFQNQLTFVFLCVTIKKKDFPLLKYMFFEQMNQTFSQEVFYEGL